MRQVVSEWSKLDCASRARKRRIDDGHCAKILQAWSACVGPVCWEASYSKCKPIAGQTQELVTSDKDVGFLHKFVPTFVEVFASQLLDNRSSLTCEEQLKGSVRVYIAAGKSEKLSDTLYR